MKNIVLIGTGKACLLHLNSYKKFINANFFLVDNDKTINEKFSLPVYHDLKKLLLILNPDETVVDIVTPATTFETLINQVTDQGFYNIIVEKPYIISQKVKNNTKLKLRMIQNYLYSKIFIALKEIIQDKKILTLYTNFSKNRIYDSCRHRGMSKEKICSVFLVEMPHQIYMCDELLSLNFQKNYATTLDFYYNDVIIKDHAYGKIIENHSGIIATLESDLTFNRIEKNIEILCEGNIFIKASFIIYSTDLKKISNGNIEIYEEGKLIEKLNFEEDDNMKYCLKDYIESFFKQEDQIYKDRILAFSHHLSSYLEV